MKIDAELIENLLVQAMESPRLRMSFDLRTSPDDQSQRILNALIPGTVLPIHRHQASAETVILLKGDMDEIFYDKEGTETGRIALNHKAGCYGAQIPMGVWHGIEVRMPSVIMEVKDGPYQPLTSEDILEPTLNNNGK